MADQRHKLPTELAAEILAANVSGKAGTGETLAQYYGVLFSKIMECRKMESKDYGQMIAE